MRNLNIVHIMDLIKRNTFLTPCFKYLLFLLPFILWASVLGTSYTPEGEVELLADAQTYFAYTNHYLHHILRGVYPLWDPFIAWGRPESFLARSSGEFNPFWMFLPLLQKLGFSFTFVYLFAIVGYFFFGAIGFYLLARRIFYAPWASYLAFVLLLFSGVGTNIFSDLIVVLLFVPFVWFFYFWISFTQKRCQAYFLGMTFSLMIILVTYLPFYFLTIFLSLLMGLIVLYPRETKDGLAHYGQFAKQHPFLVAVCFFSVALSFAPGLAWYLSGKTGEYVIASRQMAGQGAETTKMAFETIAHSGILGTITLEGLFSNLQYNIHPGFVYLPIFVFLSLLLGVMSPINKKIILFASVSLFLFLVALTDMTPVLRFLYEHIFFFRHFRNLQFLFWLMMPIFTLFVVAQIEQFVSIPFKSRKEKAVMLLWVILAHVGFFVFLLSRENVLLSSFVTVGFSLVFFGSWSLGYLKPHAKMFLLGLLVIVSLQPVEAFHHMRSFMKGSTFQYSRSPYTKKEAIPRFSFLRPDENKTVDEKGFLGIANISGGAVSDTTGFGQGDYIGTRWSQLIHNNIKQEVLQGYARHKFVVYDYVRHVNPDELDWQYFENALSQRRNIAFVMDEGVLGEQSESLRKTSQSQFIDGDSRGMQVLDFDLNFIRYKTYYKTRKFLVYNDSYHSGWQAWVNNEPTKIYRANIAFKGLWLPAGENVVLMRYRSNAWHSFQIFLEIYFLVFLVYVLYSFWKQRGEK